MDIVTRSMLERFRQDRDLGHLSEDEAFEDFAAFCVLKAYDDSEFHPDHFRTGGGNDLGIDAFGVLVNGALLHDSSDVLAAVESAKQLDVVFVVVQAKTSPGFEAKVVSDLADNLKQLFGGGEPAYPVSADVADFKLSIRGVYAEIAKFVTTPPRLVVKYVTTGEQVADLIDRKLRSARRTLDSLNLFGGVFFDCVTRHELTELYKQATQAVSEQFTMVKKLALPKAPGVEEAHSGLLPAPELIRLLTDPAGALRTSLFHENVRDFQGYNEVNRKIRETLNDPERSRRFAVLHNGITIVARGMNVIGDEVTVKDFQIVNGCQTCHVLFAERDSLTGDVQIPVRLVHSVDETVIDDIVGATNRQTAISEEDLSAREQFHKELELHFAAYDAPRRLYYERRSNQYANQPDVEKTRIVSRSQLARAYAAMMLGEPDGVGHFRRLLDERKDDLFRPGDHPAAYFAAAATLYRVEWLLRNKRIKNTYSPFRYHLLSAILIKLLGALRPPQHGRQLEKACKKITDVVWDQVECERLVMLDILPRLDQAIAAETKIGTPRGEMVRLQRFTESVRSRLGVPGRP